MRFWILIHTVFSINTVVVEWSKWHTVYSSNLTRPRQTQVQIPLEYKYGPYVYGPLWTRFIIYLMI